jgi:serine/threonine protein kinase/Tol biopolymer transport system component
MDQIAHYRIVRRLGAGGMGEVWRAVDERLGRDVAIKLLARGRASPDRALRMLREAQAASALNHPGIVTVHDIGEIHGQPYLVMELVEGQRFSELGRIAPEEALRLCALAADALGAAHARGILHRDIKSDNLMYLPDGRVKVLDFGLAKVMGSSGSQSDVRPPSQTDAEPVTPVSPLAATLAGDSADPLPAKAPALAETIASTSGPHRTPLTPGTELTRAGDIVGTPAYMAPEQARGEPLDERSEIFSLGVVLYELLTGRRPFVADDVESMLKIVAMADVKPPSQAAVAPSLAPLDPVVLHALARDPAARPADMVEMAAELRAAGESLGRPARPARSRRGGTVVAMGVVVAIAGATYVAATRSASPPPPPPPPAAAPPAAAASGWLHLDTERLTHDTGCSEFPTLSADGNTIVFDSVHGSDYILESIDTRSDRHALTRGPGWDITPSISPDGKSVAYLHKGDGPFEALIVDVGFTTTPRRIAQGAMRPRWSADGKFLWAGSGRKPTRWNVATGQADRALTVPADLALLLPLELPDGSVAGVMLKPHELAGPCGIALFPPNGDMRWLFEGEVDEVLALTPDGQLVASRVVEAKRELVTIPLTGGQPKSLEVPEVDARKGLTATPSWSRVAWSNCTNHNDVAVVTGAGTSHEFAPILAGDWADAEPAPVGDHRQIVIASDRQDSIEPWLVDLDGTTPPRRIAKIEVSRMAVTADAKTLVYNTGNGSIGKVALDGSSAPVHLTDGGGEGTPAVGPDGLVYFEREEADGSTRVYTVPLAGGAAVPVLPPGSAAAAPLPTGRRLVYARGKPGKQVLVVRDLASGAEHTLSHDLPIGGAWHVRFSSDAARVVCSLGASQVFVVELASGKVLDRVVAPSRNFAGAALVGPRGQTLVVGENWWRGNIWRGQRAAH